MNEELKNFLVKQHMSVADYDTASLDQRIELLKLFQSSKMLAQSQQPDGIIFLSLFQHIFF